MKKKTTVMMVRATQVMVTHELYHLWTLTELIQPVWCDCGLIKKIVKCKIDDDICLSKYVSQF